MHRIHWIRVVVSGILLELALVAVLVPIGEIFGAPAGLGRNQTGHYAAFFTAVPVACLVPGVIAAYGTIHFWGTQILRMAGCTLGGFSAKGVSRQLAT